MDLLNDRGPLAQRAALTASQQKVCVRTVYRWLARYRDTSQMSALIAHRRGFRTGSRRLDGDRERLVTKIIEQEYLSQSRPSAEEIVCTGVGSFLLPKVTVETPTISREFLIRRV